MLGANDVAAGLVALSLPVVGRAVIVNLGWLAFRLLGLAIALPAVVALPLREFRPEK